MSIRNGLLLLVFAAFASAPAHAVFIGNVQGGTDFPEGAVSFADAVVSYDPAIQNGEPTPENRGSQNSLGVPDYQSDNNCASADDCTFVSLGDGGSITLRFLDNVLTGSDSSALDLWIFEVGPDVEDTFVEVSNDGTNWSAVGKVFGSTAGVDLDSFGFGSAFSFSFVRLTDDGDADNQTGLSVGADIDAVGAISTRAVPEPGTLALVALGVAAIATRRSTRSRH